MKSGYKIKEIAAMFGLHPDTLRYYEEQGLVSPQREENGYRTYSVQDICALNIIRNLRRLDIPTGSIAEYMEQRSIQRTLDLMSEEQRLIDRRIEELAGLKREVTHREASLRLSEKAEEGVPRIISLPPRKCYRLESPMLPEKDVDVELKRLERQQPELSGLVGARSMGAVVDGEAVRRGVYDRYSAVLFLGEQFTDWQSMLPGGLYATVLYRGEYTKLAGTLKMLTGWAQAQGYRSCGDIIELYHVDVHDTRLVSEYLTEVQLPIVM